MVIAFFNFLNKNIFTNLSKKFGIDVALVFLLPKALYSLKRIFYIWYGVISEILQRLRFTKTNANYTVFIFYNRSTFILIYIDAFFGIVKNLKIINSLKKKLLERFFIIDLRLIFHY